MNGLCAASRLQRVQTQVCSRPVSLGSFSEAQAVLDPALLAAVFTLLSAELASGSTGRGWSTPRRWLLQDGSLFDALPRMYWALWRRQGKAQAQVRLHLSLDVARNAALCRGPLPITVAVAQWHLRRDEYQPALELYESALRAAPQYTSWSLKYSYYVLFYRQSSMVR